MPFIANGGVFVPDTELYSLGTEVFLLLDLPQPGEPIAVAGRAVWSMPRSGRQQRQGTGFQFLDEQALARDCIESSLGALLDSTEPSFTL